MQASKAIHPTVQVLEGLISFSWIKSAFEDF